MTTVKGKERKGSHLSGILIPPLYTHLLQRARGRGIKGFMDFITGLAAAKTASDLFNNLRKTLSDHPETQPTEILARMGEIQNLLLDARTALHDAKERESELRAEISELKRVADIINSFEFDSGLYWYRNYPYCPNCADADRKPIRLIGPHPSHAQHSTLWVCPVDKSQFITQRIAGR